jgi:hypothetical protein
MSHQGLSPDVRPTYLASDEVHGIDPTISVCMGRRRLRPIRNFEPRPHTLSLGYEAQGGAAGLKVGIEGLRRRLAHRLGGLGLGRCSPHAPWYEEWLPG